MTLRSSVVLLALLVAFTLPVPPARAADQVVTDCGDSGGANQLRAKITAAQSSGGGTITFTCGPAIIVLQSQLPVINSLLTIDGGGTIQLSGGNTVRVLFVTGGVLTLRNITVRNGWAGNPGGAIRVSTAGLEAFDTVFQDSTSTDEGGAIYSDYSNLELENVTVKGNLGGGSGGGVYAIGGFVSLTDVTISDNRSDVSGGGLAVDGAGLRWTGGALQSNYALRGGGLRVANTVFTNARETRMTLVDVVSNAATNGSGGGILLDAGATQLLFSDGRISGNGAFTGAGVWQSGSFEAVNALFLQNSAFTRGGAIHAVAGTTTIENSTFVENSSVDVGTPFGGGGLYHEGGSTTLQNVTMRANVSKAGGNVFRAAGGLSLTNTMLAKSTTAGAGNCNTAIGGSFNLADDTSCGFGPSREGYPDLRLGALADNGGLTETILPEVDSPAVDGGTTVGCPATDQRGILRPQGAACDVGAVEVCTLPPPAPVAVKPLDGRKAKGPNVTLDWSDTTCTNKYDVLVRSGSPTGPNVFRKKKLRTSTVQTGPLVVGQTYFWRVTARGPGGRRASVWHEFKVK